MTFNDLERTIVFNNDVNYRKDFNDKIGYLL